MFVADSENFPGRKHQISTFFSDAAIFSGRVTLKHIENKEGSGAFGGMLPLKFFQNLATCCSGYFSTS